MAGPRIDPLAKTLAPLDTTGLPDMPGLRLLPKPQKTPLVNVALVAEAVRKFQERTRDHLPGWESGLQNPAADPVFYEVTLAAQEGLLQALRDFALDMPATALGLSETAMQRLAEQGYDAVKLSNTPLRQLGRPAARIAEEYVRDLVASSPLGDVGYKVATIAATTGRLWLQGTSPGAEGYTPIFRTSLFSPNFRAALTLDVGPEFSDPGSYFVGEYQDQARGWKLWGGVGMDTPTLGAGLKPAARMGLQLRRSNYSLDVRLNYIEGTIPEFRVWGNRTFETTLGPLSVSLDGIINEERRAVSFGLSGRVSENTQLRAYIARDNKVNYVQGDVVYRFPDSSQFKGGEIAVLLRASSNRPATIVAPEQEGGFQATLQVRLPLQLLH